MLPLSLNCLPLSINLNCLEIDLIGLSCDQMQQYVKYVADNLIVSLGVKKYYKVTQPLQYMQSLKLDIRTNFFESRNSAYQKSSSDENDDSGLDDFLEDF